MLLLLLLFELTLPLKPRKIHNNNNSKMRDFLVFNGNGHGIFVLFCCTMIAPNWLNLERPRTRTNWTLFVSYYCVMHSFRPTNSEQEHVIFTINANFIASHKNFANGFFHADLKMVKLFTFWLKKVISLFGTLRSSHALLLLAIAIECNSNFELSQF